LEQALILLFILFQNTGAKAVEPLHGLSTIQDFENKIIEEKTLLVDSEVKKRSVLGELYEINKDLSKATSDLDSVTVQVDNSKKTIQSFAKTISNLDRIADGQRKLLRARLRAIYKIGVRGYTEALLSSNTSDEFSRNIKFLKIVTERDHKLIVNYEQNLNQLASQQRKLRDHVKVYIQIQQRYTDEQKKYAEQKQRQLALLLKIEKDRGTHLEAIKEWRDAGKKFEEKLISLGHQPSISPEMARGSFFENRGQLKAPVPRNILQRYGMVKNNKFNTQIFHKGLFFAAIPGETVSSVFWGKIAFTGWINGYGETVIVDHGDHYYSVYAHNSKIAKKTGDSVVMGESIAKAGDTGSLRGPGLYLEIRHFSESLDPLPWLDLPSSKRL
jgi:septal ring factor EnvC (AmiA/AmiB activator)